MPSVTQEGISLSATAVLGMLSQHSGYTGMVNEARGITVIEQV